jgi:hypothetical protein
MTERVFDAAGRATRSDLADGLHRASAEMREDRDRAMQRDFELTERITAAMSAAHERVAQP